MDSHRVTELASGLASRINNLAVASQGADSRTLLAQQDELANQTLALIARDLNADAEDFQRAIVALQAATDAADHAGQQLQRVGDTIKLTAKAISAVAKLLA
ncbi:MULTISPECIES: hypothetical protein [Chromobacterium]|uniref:hypothetical protein n=1 Tax=Chromobacterium TaxID=535 RepID=UPI0005BDE618|nr:MULTISPECIES: hypothetical protein [Chromobacterium]QOZ83354.1 hypothetical protein DXT74_09920 [Chromobacterium sp. Rain0013]WON83459.1 hypothetical protein OK026_20390 [Chromobacterium haemolyticum]